MAESECSLYAPGWVSIYIPQLNEYATARVCHRVLGVLLVPQRVRYRGTGAPVLRLVITFRTDPLSSTLRSRPLKGTVMIYHEQVMIIMNRSYATTAPTTFHLLRIRSEDLILQKPTERSKVWRIPCEHTHARIYNLLRIASGDLLY